MRSLSVLAVPIYQKLSEHYSNSNDIRLATKQYILNEITQWNIKSLSQNDSYFFKPKEFKGDSESAPFEVRLIKNGPYPKMYELKFGNLNAQTDKETYNWNDKDPYRLQKALFLKKVLEHKIAPMLEKEEIDAIVFSPYNEDGLGDERHSYFYNMFSKLGKEKFDLQQMDDDRFIITKKQN